VFKIVPMRDKNLETKLRLVTLQLENWKKLHDLITYGLDKAKRSYRPNRSASLPKFAQICCRRSSTSFAN